MSFNEAKEFRGDFSRFKKTQFVVLILKEKICEHNRKYIHIFVLIAKTWGYLLKQAFQSGDLMRWDSRFRFIN
ncbi:hypothetical protein ACFL05_00155 [Patescibacteria group bacterium]